MSPTGLFLRRMSRAIVWMTTISEMKSDQTDHSAKPICLRRDSRAIGG
jgi:hypothetical protein